MEMRDEDRGDQLVDCFDFNLEIIVVVRAGGVRGHGGLGLVIAAWQVQSRTILS